MDFLTILRILWDRLAAWVTVLAGLIAILLGVIGVRDNAYVAAQMPYVISGGILGLFLLGLGATLWLSADLRDQWRALLEIRDEMRVRPEAPVDTAAGPTADAARSRSGVSRRSNGRREPEPANTAE